MIIRPGLRSWCGSSLSLLSAFCVLAGVAFAVDAISRKTCWRMAQAVKV